MIFINSCDSDTGKLFSIAHELVHVWIGENSFYNARNNEYFVDHGTEKFCNVVAAELLVPTELFEEKWESCGNGDYCRNPASKMDRNFVTALARSTRAGKTQYTEAYWLTNTNRKTFTRLLDEMKNSDTFFTPLNLSQRILYGCEVN